MLFSLTINLAKSCEQCPHDSLNDMLPWNSLHQMTKPITLELSLTPIFRIAAKCSQMICRMQTRWPLAHFLIEFHSTSETSCVWSLLSTFLSASLCFELSPEWLPKLYLQDSRACLSHSFKLLHISPTTPF